MSRKTLENARFTRTNAKVMELHLRLGPGQSGCSLECGDIPMLVNEVEY
jgi:hypothetical protein